MSCLKDIFVTKENFQLLISNIKKKLSSEYFISVNENDLKFIDLVDKIATTVFTHEKKNFKDKNTTNSLKIINNIIIKEVVKYIVSREDNKNVDNNKEDYQNDSEKIDYNFKNEPEKVEDKITEEEIDIFLEKEETVFNSSIYNVKKININGIYMSNGEYCINDKNNKLCFKEKNEDKYIEISLDNGDYSNFSLLKEIEFCLKEASVNNYNYEVYLEKNTNKVIISSERIYELQKNSNTSLTFKELKNKIKKNNEKVFTIDKEKSTLLKVLGFDKNSNSYLENKSIMISENPLNLKKPFKINLNVSLYNESLEKIIGFDKSFIFKGTCETNEKNYYPILFTKQFSNSVSIHKILIDFKGYNHRGFDYSIDTVITQEQLI